MAITEKIAKTTGKFTGSTFRMIKSAPKKTVNKSKALKDAFSEGLSSTSNQTSGN